MYAFCVSHLSSRMNRLMHCRVMPVPEFFSFFLKDFDDGPPGHAMCMICRILSYSIYWVFGIDPLVQEFPWRRGFHDGSPALFLSVGMLHWRRCGQRLFGRPSEANLAKESFQLQIWCFWEVEIAKSLS